MSTLSAERLLDLEYAGTISGYTINGLAYCIGCTRARLTEVSRLLAAGRASVIGRDQLTYPTCVRCRRNLARPVPDGIR